MCFGVGNLVFGPQNHGRRCAGASGGFSPGKIGVPLGQGCVLGVSGPILKLQAPFSNLGGGLVLDPIFRENVAKPLYFTGFESRRGTQKRIKTINRIKTIEPK